MVYETGQDAPRGGERVFHGWWIVLVAAIGMFFGYGAVFNFTFGVFSTAASQEFQWSRSAISLAYALSLVAYAAASPVVGRLVDRLGARTVIVPSVVCFGLCFLSLYWLTPHVWHFSAVCLLMGLVGGGSALVPYFNVITHWFDRRRGVALAMAMVGVGLSNFTMPSLTQAMIAAFGWREAYLLVGIAVMSVVIPVGLFLKEKPELMGLRPDGDSTAPLQSKKDDHLPRGITGPEALSTKTFWLLFAAIFFVATSVIGCLIHLVPMLKDRGMSASAAAFATSLFGGAVIPGRLGSGYLLDRYFATRVALGFFCGATVGILLLWSGVTGGPAYLAAFLVGMGMGAEGEIMAYLVSRYFGLRAFGEILGYMMISFTLGGIVGPLALGVGYDRMGSYGPILTVFLTIMGIGMVLMTRLGPYRK